MSIEKKKPVMIPELHWFAGVSRLTTGVSSMYTMLLLSTSDSEPNARLSRSYRTSLNSAPSC